MTTEILRNAIFEDPASLADVDYVIFDEVHFLDDPERGAVWEEALIFAPAPIRFICLSATIANIDELGAWIHSIRGHELVVIESSKRPVPLHHFLHHGRGGHVRARRARPAPGPGAPGRRRGGRGKGRAAGRRGRRGARGPRGRGRRGEPVLPPAAARAAARRAAPPGAPAGAGLLLQPASDCERAGPRATRGASCSTRASARACGRCRRSSAGSSSSTPRCSGELFAMALHGIGYHHAGMLPIHKELVERMFTSGLLKLLFTTETFALGINMPARAVVFHGAAQVRRRQRRLPAHARLPADGRPRRAPGHRRRGPGVRPALRRGPGATRRSSAWSPGIRSRSSAASGPRTRRCCTWSASSAASASSRPGRSPSTASSTAARAARSRRRTAACAAA